ncbi:hypothetical protein IEO21_05026 [Rhodonia placenta]|uniref:Uncharacterized protein n=1 Tax=Rhodonia placenta TaxID=104341 RepID=A0A8H7P2N3_9APHY|nr:hypothetical protein IEO21_05026 [Postia placenta]
MASQIPQTIDRDLFTRTITGSASLSRFIHLLNGSPHIAKFVEELCFDAHANYVDTTLKPWIHELATIPVSRLTRIRSLRFSKVRCICFEKNEALLRTLRTYATVQEVHFCECSFPTFIDFEVFVAALPAVTRFSVDLIIWSVADKLHIDRMIADPPKLQLSIVEFLWMPIPPTLRSVAFQRVMLENAQLVGIFLTKLGPGLRNLRIGCRFDKDPAMTKCLNRHIDLSRNEELRSLHLVIADLQDYLMPWVPAILAQIKHVPLRWLTLEVCLDNGLQLVSDDWVEIVALLDNEWVATLEEVIIMHRGNLPIRYTNASWTWRFPGLVKREYVHPMTALTRVPELCVCKALAPSPDPPREERRDVRDAQHMSPRELRKPVLQRRRRNFHAEVAAVHDQHLPHARKARLVEQRGDHVPPRAGELPPVVQPHLERQPLQRRARRLAQEHGHPRSAGRACERATRRSARGPRGA